MSVIAGELVAASAFTTLGILGFSSDNATQIIVALIGAMAAIHAAGGTRRNRSHLRRIEEVVRRRRLVLTRESEGVRVSDEDPELYDIETTDDDDTW